MTDQELVLRRPRRRRPRVTVVGVLGELLITAGVVVMLFLGWQLWLNDLMVRADEKQEALDQTEQWNEWIKDNPEPVAEPGEPPVHAAVAETEKFAQLLVPRFGDGYYPRIAEGVSTSEVLNRNLIGHYDDTAMPGELGNFALAAHRKAYGGFFEHLDELRVGDSIYVETRDGWYEYRFRNLEYVRPTGVGVLNPVPQAPEVEATERILTLTTCNPLFSTAERLIAYATFARFFPRNPDAPAAGAPEDIAGIVAQAAG